MTTDEAQLMIDAWRDVADDGDTNLKLSITTLRYLIEAHDHLMGEARS